jgi:hypothetical protein
MSQYYNPKRTRNLFDENSQNPFRLSRSKIDLFLECPRCFYLDRRLGLARPPGYPFTLNSAVDTLLKKEFDTYREQGTAHPLMKKYGIDAIPFRHKDINKWRDSLRGGITYLHPETSLLITGGIDDVWVNPGGNLIVVDYKSTSKKDEVTLDADWQDSYKRQMEMYQWLFRRNDFEVSPIGYFVYCNGDTDKEMFDCKLEFDVKIIPYEGNDSWVASTIQDIHNCLCSNSLPDPGDDCDYCKYREAVRSFGREA